MDRLEEGEMEGHPYRQKDLVALTRLFKTCNSQTITKIGDTIEAVAQDKGRMKTLNQLIESQQAEDRKLSLIHILRIALAGTQGRSRSSRRVAEKPPRGTHTRTSTAITRSSSSVRLLPIPTTPRLRAHRRRRAKKTAV